MRKISAQTCMTQDGVMQGLCEPDEVRDGGFDQGGWSVNYWDDMRGEVTGAAMAPTSASVATPVWCCCC